MGLGKLRFYFSAWPRCTTTLFEGACVNNWCCVNLKLTAGVAIMFDILH